MTYDDEILMAYADGELDAERSAEISRAAERDPQLARRIADHRALRTRVADALSPVLEQPVPARLRAVAAGTPGNVIDFPAVRPRPESTGWRWREWSAMAASVLLGAFLTWRVLAPGTGEILRVRDGNLVAGGALDHALSRQLASAQSGTEAVRIGVSFKARDGEYCRSFSLRDSAAAGLACRSGDDWRIEALRAREPAAGGIRQAAGETPPEILALIEQRIAGEPLDSAGEHSAHQSNWQGDRLNDTDRR